MNKFQIWLMSWAQILNGIVGVLCFGFYSPKISLNTAKFFVMRNGRKPEPKMPYGMPKKKERNINDLLERFDRK